MLSYGLEKKVSSHWSAAEQFWMSTDRHTRDLSSSALASASNHSISKREHISQEEHDSQLGVDIYYYIPSPFTWPIEVGKPLLIALQSHKAFKTWNFASRAVPLLAY